jgi:nucleotide-binding universal stress UspA family protein
LYDRILVPHDGSPFAEQVLPYATELARRLNAEVHLFESIPPPSPLVYSAVEETPAAMVETVEVIEEGQEALAQQAKTRLSTLAGQLKAQGLNAFYAVAEGEPAVQIVEYATAHQIGLIAMASHGRSGIARAVLGSVTDAVVRQGHCPVMIVRVKE